MNSPEPSLRVGFVGIGTMGAPMVRCLHRAGHAVTIHDIDAAAAGAVAAELDVPQASSLAALAHSCDLIILMLPNSAIVRAVIGTPRDGGLFPHLRQGAVIVDMSSSDPLETRRIGAGLAATGTTLLDAPVSGGLRKAIAGTLAILLGGDDDVALDRAAPVLSAMGQVLRTGALGSGHATKALNNYVSAAGLAAACEAVIIGRAFGLDPDVLTDAINASTGRNNSTENKLKQFILNESYRDAGFALDLMAKDVALAASLGDAMAQDLPGLQAARDLWSAAHQTLGQGADHTEIYRYLAQKGAPES